MERLDEFDDRGDVVCIVKPVPVPAFVLEPYNTIEKFASLDVVHYGSSNVRAIDVMTVFVEDFDKRVTAQVFRREHRAIVIPYSLAEWGIVPPSLNHSYYFHIISVFQVVLGAF